jgi:hypothetical protein
MMKLKPNPHTEYRRQENLRINASPSLAEKFPDLKSLAAVLTYFDSAGLVKMGEIKYTANLAHANSVFSVACANNECIGGDFDLSNRLADAISAHSATAAGEMSCQGWQSRMTMDTQRCHRILRYRLQLGY